MVNEVKKLYVVTRYLYNIRCAKYTSLADPGRGWGGGGAVGGW